MKELCLWVIESQERNAPWVPDVDAYSSRQEAREAVARAQDGIQIFRIRKYVPAE